MNSSDPKNIEKFHFEKHVHETILKELDEEVEKTYPDEVEIDLRSKENKKVLLTLANEKWPPVTYCETFEAKSFPESKLFIYNLATYIVPLYDDSGQKLPESAIDGDTSRGVFFCKTLIILALQLVSTISCMLGGVFIKLSDKFHRTNHTGMVLVCAIAMGLYGMIYFLPWARKTCPYDLGILITFTVCSIYALGSFHAEFNEPMHLVYTLSGALAIFLLLYSLASSPCVQLTSSVFYAILNQILPSMLFTFIVASLYALHTNVLFLFFIFLIVYLIMECFFILHLFQLILGRGGSHAMKTDEHILAAVLLYIHINTIHIILLILLSIGPYAILSLGNFGCKPSEGSSNVSQGTSKLS